MGRLNFRDSDYHIRNSTKRSRVKERSYMFEQEYAQRPPKILISSVSEDRSSMVKSRSFRPAAARSWSTEDFLADSPHMDDISSIVAEDPKDPVDEVLTNSTSDFPQLCQTHSLASSSVLESVTGDSAINSPDSWVESEFGPEKLCESQSDSSLCDSGTAWYVYRATPVEVTTVDDGVVPSIDDKAPVEQWINESLIDEGIYSLGSLESTQERIQGQSEEKQVKVENYENTDHYIELEHLPEVDYKYMDTIIKDKVPKQQELFEMCDVEVMDNSSNEDVHETYQFTLNPKNDLTLPDHFSEQISVEDSTDGDQEECLQKTVDFTGNTRIHKVQTKDRTESLNKINHSEDAGVEAECLLSITSVENKVECSIVYSGILNKSHETPDTESGAVVRDHPNCQSHDALASTHSTNQEGASNKSLEQSVIPEIPLISIFSEPEEDNKESDFNPESPAQAGNKEVYQQKLPGRNATDTANSPHNPDELSCQFRAGDDKSLVDISSCLIAEIVETATLEQTREMDKGHLDDADGSHIVNCSNVNTCVSYIIDNEKISIEKQEFEFHNESDSTDKMIIAEAFTDTKSQLVEIEQVKPTDTQSTQIRVQSDKSVKTEILPYEQENLSRNVHLFNTYTDRGSPIEDIFDDPIEPMDLFYPDKEEPMFTEPPDTEMQSWPSVLSVSALEPAPASETLSDDLPLRLLVEDFTNGVDVIQENDKVNVSIQYLTVYSPTRGSL